MTTPRVPTFEDVAAAQIRRIARDRDSYDVDHIWIPGGEVEQIGDDGYWVDARVWIPMAWVEQVRADEAARVGTVLPADDPRPF